jgi:hypothetical protein
MPTTPIEERLSFLHAHYVGRINAAIAADRMDLVEDLAGAYEDEALALMLAEGSTQNQGHGEAIEILEFGGWRRWPGVRRPGSWASWFRRHWR